MQRAAQPVSPTLAGVSRVCNCTPKKTRVSPTLVGVSRQPGATATGKKSIPHAGEGIAANACNCTRVKRHLRLALRLALQRPLPRTHVELRAEDFYARVERLDHKRSRAPNHLEEGRPQLDALMKAARHRAFDCVLVWKFDRFARSTAHLINALEEFNHLRIRFISVQDQIDTDSPMGKAMEPLAATDDAPITDNTPAVTDIDSVDTPTDDTPRQSPEDTPAEAAEPPPVNTPQDTSKAQTQNPCVRDSSGLAGFYHAFG